MKPPRIEMALDRAGFRKNTVVDGDRKHIVFELKCRACLAVWKYTPRNSSLLPPNVILKNARREGWFVAEGKNPLCQQHAVGQMIFKTIVMRDEPVAPVHHPLRNEEMGQEANNLSIAQPNMKLVRQVMSLLEEHFDEKSMRYKGNYGDEKIAKDTGLHVVQVARIRSEAYGELADDPAVIKLRDDIAALQLYFEDGLKQSNIMASRLETYLGMRKVGG